MKHANAATNSATLNDSFDRGNVRIEIQKLNESIIGSDHHSTWSLTSVHKSGAIVVHDAIPMLEDRNSGRTNTDKAQVYMDIVNQSFGIDEDKQELTFQMDIVDGELSAVRWALRERIINSDQVEYFRLPRKAIQSHEDNLRTVDEMLSVIKARMLSKA